MKNHIVEISRFLPILLALALASCGQPEPSPRIDPAAEPIAVRVETLRLREQVETYEAIGTVRARNTVRLSSKIVSHVLAIHVNEGDQVREGQLLAELDDRELAASLRQAEAATTEVQDAIREAGHALAAAEAHFELSELTHQRFRDLLAKKSVSQHEYDEASAGLRAARAAVEMTRARRGQAEAKLAQAEAAISVATVMLGHAEIRAPFAGVVTERRADPGALAAPGSPILTIDRRDAYRLEAELPESRLTEVREGQAAAVKIDALGETFEGTVVEIVPSVDSRSRTFVVKVALPNHPGLRTGMFGRALLPGAERTVLTVPAAAVIERGQVQSVFVVEEGLARRRLVSLGERVGDAFAVLSGLREGDDVVLNVPAFGALTDGSPVRASPQTSPAENGAAEGRP